jgi:hypothetical protein
MRSSVISTPSINRPMAKSPLDVLTARSVEVTRSDVSTAVTKHPGRSSTSMLGPFPPPLVGKGVVTLYSWTPSGHGVAVGAGVAAGVGVGVGVAGNPG